MFYRGREVFRLSGSTVLTSPEYQMFFLNPAAFVEYVDRTVEETSLVIREWIRPNL